MTTTPSENEQIDYDAVETQFSDSKKAELDSSVYHEAERNFDGSAEANRKEYEAVLNSDAESVEKRELSPEQADSLVSTLKSRFESSENKKLRKVVDFADVEKSLRAAPEQLYALLKLEETGGEPQIIGLDGDEFVFEDRCIESPSGRRDLNFDKSLVQAEEFGADMQSPDAYKAMQKTGKYDMKTGGWLKTDPEYRERTGRAVNGDRDGDDVRVYEDDAERRDPDVGWRASLRVKKV